jgi:biotin/methionine sulfoxide reductase
VARRGRHVVLLDLPPDPDGECCRATQTRYPLHLVANNPTARLHSQLDVGAFSQSTKVQGREPIRIHSADAAARGIRNGDVVRVFNDRGSCLAGAVVTDTVRPRVVQLSTRLVRSTPSWTWSASARRRS